MPLIAGCFESLWEDLRPRTSRPSTLRRHGSGTTTRPSRRSRPCRASSRAPCSRCSWRQAPSGPEPGPDPAITFQEQLTKAKKLPEWAKGCLGPRREARHRQRLLETRSCKDASPTCGRLSKACEGHLSPQLTELAVADNQVSVLDWEQHTRVRGMLHVCTWGWAKESKEWRSQ